MESLNEYGSHKVKAQILSYLQEKELGELKQFLVSIEKLEFIRSFTSLSPDEQVIVFRLLPKEKALDIFETLDTSVQQHLLRSFTDERAIEFVNEMAPDDRVRLFDELPVVVAKKLLGSLSVEERESTNLLMGYEQETAGRILTTEFISLKKDMTVKAALEKVRQQAEEKETIYLLYVTTEQKKLIGVLSLKDLLIADSDQYIEEIMSKHIMYVTTDTDQEKTARLLQELDLIAMPVVDKELRLVGIVTVDDAIDVLEQETTEDMFNAAGLADVSSLEADRSNVLIHGSLWEIWKVRLPFLVITLVAGIFAGVVIDEFEQTLESVAAVAVFIPLIMDMGGNVGTQSSTVFVRGMSLGHINLERFMKYFLKEVGIGFSLGVVVGIVSGIVAAVWQGIPLLGVAVGISLVFAMTLAAALGFFIPFILLKMNIDQAAGAAPIITSIKDIAGLLIYFVSVNLLLSHLL
ncbi:magnesium transporter [Enterococcus sp. 5H]|uniref:magnesium transporter n=1 Tax=Enterococcus sp. 5H TaxID=1229490 RepID=UPI0023022E85|nr:magnesium transporter [Enterococcus sp. 5H]MDA9470666.1 Magnesium transporter [Enterococcus sp. 5H]